ncbi:MAG: glycosyltransferase family 39 protein [Proteobacteria bacterium]|nr:glycosyltransferase family 39 protein [Pseudomonadota bacterium]
MQSKGSAAGRVAVLVLLALAPLWLTGMFGRALWTPDEPREADIAWRMSTQTDRTLPQLAGTPFLEKPPLTYWMSAAAIAAFGDSPAAARVPNLVYVAVTALGVAALALAMGLGAMPATLSALVAGSALLAFRVGIWLAPDAGLVAGNALALLGLWHGYTAPPGAAKLRGYLLMHAGAAIGFMAKSAPGWLVPALALAVMVVWERRWSELRRPELYAGLLLQAAIIGPWIASVSASAQGAAALRTLFWNNVVGRFTQVQAPAALDYTTGHHNRPGKYLLELPYYLLPWTLVAAAALRRAWRRARNPGGQAWRFAVSASLPFLALLSLAATARDVYAAPALLGLAVLAGLWLQELHAPLEAFDRACISGTRVLVAVFTALFVAALAVLALSGTVTTPACITLGTAVTGVGLLAWLRSSREQLRGHPGRSLAWCYTGYAAAVSLTALVLLPTIDRWQDLGSLARRIRHDTAALQLAVLDPDETTLAVLDHGFDAPAMALGSSGQDKQQAVAGYFAAHPADGRVLVLLPGHASGRLRRWLAQFHADTRPDDGPLTGLVASGTARLVQRYELPQGRRYALLGPGTDTTHKELSDEPP